MMKKLLAAAVCGAFAASALAAMPEKVTIVYVKSPFNLQNMVMKEKGMLEKAFEKDGVKVEWKSINSGAKQAQAMAAGAVDVSAVMNTASLLMANGSGNPVYVASGVSHPTDTFAIVGKPGASLSVKDLKGKKVAMTWAYSPSYGKPLSVPQGVIGLFTRFGMDVTLAHPEGYDVFPEVEEIARKNCEKYGSKFHKTNSMAEAFKDADIVYPKSWAPFKAMEKRSELYVKGDQKGIDELEKELLAQNAQHKDWTCSEEMMKLTKDGKALYLHCLPADISGLSCPEGEVDNSVFDRYLVPLYKQASYKPYIIAAMIFLAQVKDPVKALMDLDSADNKRKMF